MDWNNYAVDVDVLNEKFVYINIPTSASGIYDNLCYIALENSAQSFKIRIL